MINLGYTYLFEVKSLTVHLIITMALTAMTTLLLLVILILDHPFKASAGGEPLMKCCSKAAGRLDRYAPSRMG